MMSTFMFSPRSASFRGDGRGRLLKLGVARDSRASVQNRTSADTKNLFVQFSSLWSSNRAHFVARDERERTRQQQPNRPPRQPPQVSQSPRLGRSPHLQLLRHSIYPSTTQLILNPSCSRAQSKCRRDLPLLSSGPMARPPRPPTPCPPSSRARSVLISSRMSTRAWPRTSASPTPSARRPATRPLPSLGELVSTDFLSPILHTAGDLKGGGGERNLPPI